MAWVLLRTLGGYLLLGRLMVAMMVASAAGCCGQIFGQPLLLAWELASPLS